jgi:hypothetical protein
MKNHNVKEVGPLEKCGMVRRDFLRLGIASTLAGVFSPRFLSAAEAGEKEAMLGLIDDGLPKAGAAKSVLVIGGGMAGLVAAYELKRAGHQVTVLEASRRIGGRVWTLREPFTHGLYAEGGAMRIPDAHRLTWRYIDKFGLETQPFIMERSKQFLRIGNQQRTWEEFQKDPSTAGFDLKPNERGKTPRQLWEETVGPLREQYNSGGWGEPWQPSLQFKQIHVTRTVRRPGRVLGRSLAGHLQADFLEEFYPGEPNYVVDGGLTGLFQLC